MAKASLQEPHAGHVPVVIGKPHQNRHEEPVRKDTLALRVRSARTNTDRLQA